MKIYKYLQGAEMRKGIVSCLLIMFMLLSDIALRASNYKNQGPVTTLSPYRHNTYVVIMPFALARYPFQIKSTNIPSNLTDSCDQSACDDLPSSPGASSVGNDSMCRQGSWVCLTPNKTPKGMKSNLSAPELAGLAAYANYSYEPAVDHGVSSPSKATPKKCGMFPKPRGLHGTQTPLDHGTSSPSKTPKKNRNENVLLEHGTQTPLEHGVNGSPRKTSPKKF
jgi:hypothetical protein